MNKSKEKTLVLLKPDALQRNFLGQVISRFENKGLKIIGLKMIQMGDLVNDHYSQYINKPFFKGIKDFMTSSPVVAIVLEGLEVIKIVRTLTGPTSGREAAPGTIRGDFSISIQANLVHASDSPETAEKEIWRFFNADEIFDYKKSDFDVLYAEDEK